MTELAHRVDGGGGDREFNESQVKRDGKGRFSRQAARAEQRKTLRKFVRKTKEEMANLSDKEFADAANDVAVAAVLENMGVIRQKAREAADASGEKFVDVYSDPPRSVIEASVKAVNARSASTLTSKSGNVRVEAYYDSSDDSIKGRVRR